MPIIDEILISLKKAFTFNDKAPQKRRKKQGTKKNKQMKVKTTVKKKVAQKKKTAKKKVAPKKKTIAKKKVDKKKGEKKKKTTPLKKTIEKKAAPKKKPLKKIVKKRPQKTVKKDAKIRPKKKIVKSKKTLQAKPKQKTAKQDKPIGQLVGEITHYFDKIKVVVVKVTASNIKVGDQLMLKKGDEILKQKILSLQVESVDVKVAKKSQLVGMKVSKPVKVGALVYKL